ncbi:MAG: Gldg family protein [Thermodesulfobacteriota bacterium]|nr:Gldg family protein [Thermodesulfobacteriota bacterium]
MKDKLGNYIRFIIYVIVVVLVNLAGITFFFRLDLTENKVYSLSNVSKQVVSTLSEPLTINVFFTKNLPAPHNNTERYLHDLLEEYSVHANRFFNYRFYDVSPDEGDITEKERENQELAKNYGIFPVQIRRVERDEVKFQRAYMGLVVIHGDLIERISTITSTEGLEYKLTTAIQKLNNKISALLSLKEKIQVKLFLSSSLERVAPYLRVENLPDLPERVETIVQRVNNRSYGTLKFQHLDPTKDQSVEKDLEKYDILSLKWPALSQGNIEAGRGAIGLVMEYGEKAVTLPLIRVLRVPLIGTRYQLADLNRMEETIGESLESLIDINEDLGFLADHDTLKISAGPPVGAPGQQREETLRSFRNLVSQNYTIKEVKLKDETIPRGLDCMIIAGPKETFDEYTLFQIDQFLMQGKSLAVFLDRFNEVLPPDQRGMSFQRNQGPMYIPLNTGLEKLLEHYGIRIKKSYIMDENCFKQQLPAQFGGGERPIYFVPLIMNRFIDKELDFMKNIKGMAVMKASPLELDKERIADNDLQAYRLFASSEKSWEMRDRINLNPMFIQPPAQEEERQSLPLAYILEGRFSSYFAGKPIPEKKTEETSSEKKDPKEKQDEKLSVDLSKIEAAGEFLSKGKPAKIFVMASSNMLKDNILDEEGKSPNAMFIMNMIDYLNSREGFAVMRSKEQWFNPLDESGPATKTFVKSFNIAGLPVLVVIFGLFVWFRRHSRKRYIQTMFQR